MRLILFAGVFCFLTSINFAFSIQDQSNFERIKISKFKNLPQNDVNCIYKDKLGFLWIGTLDGLHRFDGYEYKTFRVDDGENSISSNLIIAIDEDNLGNIWIATYDKGLSKFNPKNETFTSYRNTEANPGLFDSNDITFMMVDTNNVIWTGNWFGTSYRIMLDDKMETIEQIDRLMPKTDKNQTDKLIRTLLQDQSGNIWIGTNENLFRCLNPYEPAQNLKFEHYPIPGRSLCNTKNGIISGGFQLNELVPGKTNQERYTIKLIENSTTTTALYWQNDILWSGDREGIHLYLRDKTGQYTRRSNFTSSLTEDGITGNIVYCITGSENGQIWVGTRGGGISTFNLNRKKFMSFHPTNEKGSISNNLCRSVFEDHFQNLWIGTEEGGLDVLPVQEKTNYAKGFKQLTLNDRLEENRAYAIEELLLPNSKKHKSVIWAGTSFKTSLVAFDPVNLQRVPLSAFASTVGFVFAIERYDDSLVWVGTYGDGLYKFRINPEGEITGHQWFMPEKLQKNGISSKIIRSILKDSKGNLWVGTDKGLNLIRKDEIHKNLPKFEVFSKGIDSTKLNHDYILQIIESSKGKIWIGTMGGGLLGYHEATSGKPAYFKAITTKDGLPNNSIKSIVEDNDGLLWLSSNKGISRYNPANGEIINYDVNDGLQDNEFAEISAVKRKNGQLVFGGINGFNVFYPNEIVTDTVKPHLFLTDFYIQNKQVKPTESVNGRVILENALQFTEKITLKYPENSFSIGFVALQFNSPQKNRYKYKLEGFDNQWFTTTSLNRIAKYTNIPPGDYTFKVMGSNCDNLWSDQPARVKIHINQPFYLKLNAFIVYFILIGIILWYTIRTSKIIIQRKREVLLANFEKNKAEEISQIKLRFFTNITHEIRTPLTLIYTPLENLIKNNLSFTPSERNQNYQLIRQNTNVLMRMINQLMDFRKLDQNKLKLKARKQDLNVFIDSVYQAFIPLAERKNIEFTSSHDSQPIELWFDANKLENVMYNLLSNAFKFTPNDGKISIGITNPDQLNEVIIHVKDTGIGIEQDESIHIFERYYQPDKKQAQEGTGIGLAFSKDLVELHHGIIEFESEAGKGSTFSIHLLKGNAHFSKEEIDDSILTTQKEIIKPVADENEAVIQKTSGKKADRNQPKVLIVEDNIDLRHLLISDFKQSFQVFDAEDGEQGLKMCKMFYPDIVISDIMMPVIDGIEMCRAIKTDEEISHIPVILLTAKNAPEAQIEGFSTGADNYVTKPFNMEVLHARVISLIKNRELLRQKFSKDISINPAVISHSEADSRFLNKILAIIEENLANSDFSVEQLAEQYGVSRIYLNRKIKALTDETSNQFILNIRLKHAAEMLKNGTMTVSEVTWAVGYNDLRTFRNRFKDKFGVSPSEFLKSYQEQQGG